MAFAWDESGSVGSLGGLLQLACNADPVRRWEVHFKRGEQLTRHYTEKATSRKDESKKNTESGLLMSDMKL